ncbi:MULTISPECIES: GntR family transcriptional regulator [unclassified Cytobacillus]|uniref:GntR family transcriptional regulator n=1 Tax=unclassified Cytobacillus TaxID=2675268 RepID=UPI00203BB454|nr:GntR family transcriptional regulator [Cytobacillus sp. AMY 15.2]MCM3094196.1 GntR family transcriptional regulator [Cytobacillus sp. AMY 15.2]
MQIDKSSHIPLYRQVEQILEEKIISGQWEVGSQLPTEQELSGRFDVSTITVKRAVIELVNKGYLFRQRGKGTFVSGAAKEQDLNSILSLSTGSEQEHPHDLLNFQYEKAGSEIAQKLRVDPEDGVIRIERLKVENNDPLALEYTYLPAEKCQGLTPEMINNDLIFNILKSRFHIALNRAKVFIRPYILPDHQAKLLQVEPGTPVFEWERTTYTKQEDIIEFSKFYIRSDKAVYYTEVQL